MLRDKPLILGPEPEAGHSAAADVVIGRILYERFLIERELPGSAAGGGLRAYVAKDLKNYCSRVVLRWLENLSDERAEGSPSYEQLCNVLIGLDHPNVDQIVEAGKLFDGRPYSVSTLFTGQPLSEILSQGKRLTVEQTARVTDAVYEGLAAAHARKILHCSVNPANILISDFDGPSESIRLINFGAAWPINVCTNRADETVAEDDPLCFAAPETLFKLSHRSPASDVYSLAALVYRMLVGKVPFKAADRESLLAMVAAGEMELPTASRTDLRLETERLITDGLSAEAAWRPQKIDDFGTRLVFSLRGPDITPEISSEKPLPVQEFDADPTQDGNELIIEMPVAASESVEKRLTRVQPRPPTAFSDRAITWSLIVLLLAGALSIPVGRIFMSESAKASAVGTMVPKPPESDERRQIKYSIENGEGVSKRQAGLSSKRQLSLTAENAGELYVIEELAAADAPFEFRLAYPKAGSAAVEAGKNFRIDIPGTSPSDNARAIWIVWQAEKNSELEWISNGNAPAVEDVRKLKHFLERNRNLRVQIGNDYATGQVILTGSGERIVHRITVEPDPTLTAQK